MSGVILMLFWLLAYFAPSIVALAREHSIGPVVVVNFFLGWTFIGWVVALAMACGSNRPPPSRDYSPHRY